jgi:type IV secretory pathway TraG/TraD family ATPase VirD4
MDLPRSLAFCCLFFIGTLSLVRATPPDFGPNVMIFNPSMPMSQIQNAVDAIANRQISNQFGTQ